MSPVAKNKYCGHKDSTTRQREAALMLIAFVLQLSIGGIIILKDTSEDMEELVEPVAAHGPKIEEEEQEPEPPEPFEYIDD